MAEVLKLSMDEFIDTYDPEQEDCILRYYETYGLDLLIVKAMAKTFPNHVWTVLDCDGKLIIQSGYHHVNRVNYILTNKQAECSNVEVSYC